MTTLNPDSPFEAQVIRIIEMHRAKSAVYSPGDDLWQNFRNAAFVLGHTTPRFAAEAMKAKHDSVIINFLDKGGEFTKYTDDAYLDRAVYGVICLALYEEEKEA